MRIAKVVSLVFSGLTVAFIAAQLVPYRPDRSIPTHVVEPAWDTPETRDLAVRACFDCHSAQTQWPWYASVAPVSWMIRSHIEEGRAVLDFSRWDAPGEEAGEAGEVTADETMPPAYYIRMHAQARLTDSERSALAAGLDRTIGKEEETHELSN